MRKLLLAASVALVGMGVSASAFAQTCASPLPAKSNTPFSGDTCAGTNAFPSFPGGIPSPQNDVVYSFVAQGADAVITVQGSAGLAAPGWVILAPCDAVNGNIVASGSNSGGSATAPALSGLTDGTTYYLVVTTDPGAGQPNTACGTFSGTVNGTLPVQLQNFSVQ